MLEVQLYANIVNFHENFGKGFFKLFLKKNYLRKLSILPVKADLTETRDILDKHAFLITVESIHASQLHSLNKRVSLSKH